MVNTNNKDDCGEICNLDFSDSYSCSSVSSDAVQVVQETNTILLTDEILVLRNTPMNGQEVYKASFKDLDPEIALLIMECAAQMMPKTDPADGKSLWLDDGFIRVASGDPSLLGTLNPRAMQQSLKEAFKYLPTSDPGDGSPWLNNGVLMQGSAF